VERIFHPDSRNVRLDRAAAWAAVKNARIVAVQASSSASMLNRLDAEQARPFDPRVLAA
jgi:hypothetical protein